MPAGRLAARPSMLGPGDRGGRGAFRKGDIWYTIQHAYSGLVCLFVSVCQPEGALPWICNWAGKWP